MHFKLKLRFPTDIFIETSFVGGIEKKKTTTKNIRVRAMQNLAFTSVLCLLSEFHYIYTYLKYNRLKVELEDIGFNCY